MNSTRILAAVLVVVSVILLGSDVSPAAGSEVSLPNTEIRTIRSKHIDQEFRLLVARPFVRPGTASKFPVIYLLDADMSFPLARQVALSLQSGQELPPVLIVGIGYPGGLREGMQLRTRDYTPTADPVFTKYAERWGGSGSSPGSSGRAADFLRFLREELKPFIEADYPVDPGDSTIFGVSFGGLFATYTLLTEPDTFQRYVIGSPSLWWDGRAIFETEAAFAKGHQDLPARVFIAAGGRETAEHEEAALAKIPEEQRRPMLEFQEAIGGGAQMIEVIEPFVDRLSKRGYPSLDLSLYIFPDETHASVPPMTLSRGLKVVFDTF